MNPGYECVCRHSAGNLHVDLFGEFNGRCVWELFKLLRQHGGSKRVFVNTAGIRQLAGDGVQLFRSCMTRRRLQHDWLYFNGIQLGGKPFAVFAPGDSSYENFCGSVDMLEEKMTEMGGKLVTDGLRADGDPGDYKEEIASWTTSISGSV